MSFAPSIPLIFSKDISDPINRIEINDGIEVKNNDEDYLVGSVVPNSSFQTIDGVNFEKLLSKATLFTRSNKNFIGIINMERLASPFFALNIQHCRSVSDIDSITKTPEYSVAIDHLIQGLNDYFFVEGEVTILGISIKQSLLQTVTIDRKINQRIGLHLDSWDKRQLHYRDNARNRICLNLGLEARYFVFLNKTINELLTELDLPSSKVNGGSELGRMFLKKKSRLSNNKTKSKTWRNIYCPNGEYYSRWDQFW